MNPQYYYYNDSDPIPLEGRLNYGDFKKFEGEVIESGESGLFRRTLDQLYLMPDLMSGGDYSNGSGSVTVANHKVFLERFGKIQGVYDIWGGYGTYAVVINAALAESHEEIKETLDAMEEYPIIDDQAYCEVERDWEESAMKDLVPDIIRKIDMEELLPDYETYLEDAEHIEDFLWEGIGELNLNWISETTSSYLDDNEKLIPYVEDRLLLEHFTEWPLLISRQWSCEQTQTMYEEKLKGGLDGGQTNS